MVTASWRPVSAFSRSRLWPHPGRCSSLTDARQLPAGVDHLALISAAVNLDRQLGQPRTTLQALGGGKITLREAQAIAYLLEHGRWPDPETAAWFEQRTSRVALDFLLSARLRETISVVSLREDEEE